VRLHADQYAQTVIDPVSRIQDYLREQAREAYQSQTGATFTFFYDDPRLPLTHVAIPNAPTVPDPLAVVRQIRIAGARRGAPARVQMIDAYAPELLKRLEGAGFQTAERIPVLAMHPDGLIEPPGVEGLRIDTVDRGSAEALAAYVDAYMQGFGMARPPREAGIGMLRQELADRAAFLARVGGDPAGTAQLRRVREGVTELGSVSVVPAYRRLGIGAAVTAHAARAAFERGADLVFLLAESEDSTRLYERIGFARVGAMVEMAPT
jgi:ribosomal protein S18 acetylase RimI-like enzyme